MLTKKTVKMSDWYAQRKPFDMMRDCKWCLSMHVGCDCGYHPQVTRDAEKAGLSGSDGVTDDLLKEKLPAFFRLRKKYDSLYPKAVRKVNS